MLACMPTGATLYNYTAGSSLLILKLFFNLPFWRQYVPVCWLELLKEAEGGHVDDTDYHFCICASASVLFRKKIKSIKWLMHHIIISFHAYLCIYTVTCRIPSSPRDMNPLEPTYFELNQRPLPLAPNHITLSDMGTPGRTHTASFCSRLSVNINSHSSRALSCPKLHLWIIGHLLPERPQCGIMRI